MFFWEGWQDIESDLMKQRSRTNQRIKKLASTQAGPVVTSISPDMWLCFWKVNVRKIRQRMLILKLKVYRVYKYGKASVFQPSPILPRKSKHMAGIQVLPSHPSKWRTRRFHGSQRGQFDLRRNADHHGSFAECWGDWVIDLAWCLDVTRCSGVKLGEQPREVYSRWFLFGLLPENASKTFIFAGYVQLSKNLVVAMEIDDPNIFSLVSLGWCMFKHVQT